MDFRLSDEQVALGVTAHAVLRDAYGDFGSRRAATDNPVGFSRDVYQRLGDLGLLGLQFAEDVGGAGAGLVEVGVVAREVGRFVAPEPFLVSTVIAGGLIDAVATPEQRTDLVGSLVAGGTIAAFAHAEAGRSWSPDAVGVTAAESHGAWQLTGEKSPVAFGAQASTLVVSAGLPSGGTGLFLVSPHDANVTIFDLRTVGGGRVAHIGLDGAPAVPLGGGGADVAATIDRVLDVARVIAGHEALGAMESALSMTSSYLKERRQFGVALSSFQDLKFRAADMYVDLELTESLVQWATMAVEKDERTENWDAATRAGLQVARASRHIGEEAIQLHGAIGMTAEYAVGAYTQRLSALTQMFGNEEFYLGRLAARMDDYGTVESLI